MVCVGTQCVPSVATCVVAKIYRPIFFIGAVAGMDAMLQTRYSKGYARHSKGYALLPKVGIRAMPVASVDLS